VDRTDALSAASSWFARLDDLEALRSWAEVIVEVQRSNGYRGECPLGSLASELAESDGAAREILWMATGGGRAPSGVDSPPCRTGANSSSAPLSTN
jgi:hypothetical protein